MKHFSVIYYDVETGVDVPVVMKTTRQRALEAVEARYPHYEHVALHEWIYKENGEVTARVRIEVGR